MNLSLSIFCNVPFKLLNLRWSVKATLYIVLHLADWNAEFILLNSFLGLANRGPMKLTEWLFVFFKMPLK